MTSFTFVGVNCGIHPAAQRGIEDDLKEEEIFIKMEDCIDGEDPLNLNQEIKDEEVIKTKDNLNIILKDEIKAEVDEKKEGEKVPVSFEFININDLPGEAEILEEGENPRNIKTEDSLNIKMEDPLKIKTEVKKEEVIEEKYHCEIEISEKDEEEEPQKEENNDSSFSRGEISNQILCVFCNKIGSATEVTYRGKLGLFCESCYKKFWEKSQDEWLKHKKRFYKSCRSCTNIFYNELDFFTHNCTCVNLFGCYNCDLLVDKKAYLVNHLKYCSSHSKGIDVKGRPTCDNLSGLVISDNLDSDRCLMNDSTERKLRSQNKKCIKTNLCGQNGKKSYCCKICKKSFCSASKLKVHLGVHTDEKPFSCELCKKSFSHASSLKVHLLIHTGDRPFNCEICKKSFSRANNLKVHLLIHTGDKPFHCEFCKKSFRLARHLKYHLHIHTGEKPFPCEICKKSFRLAHHLKDHLHIHRGDKPFPCEICKKSFRFTYNLKVHLRIHTGKNSFPCEICKKSFNRNSNFKRHMLIHK